METMRLPCGFDVSTTYLVICDIDFLRHPGSIELDKFEGLIIGKCMKKCKRSNSRGDGKKSLGRGADNGDRQKISCQTKVWSM